MHCNRGWKSGRTGSVNVSTGISVVVKSSGGSVNRLCSQFVGITESHASRLAGAGRLWGQWRTELGAWEARARRVPSACRNWAGTLDQVGAGLGRVDRVGDPGTMTKVSGECRAGQTQVPTKNRKSPGCDWTQGAPWACSGKQKFGTCDRGIGVAREKIPGCSKRTPCDVHSHVVISGTRHGKCWQFLRSSCCPRARGLRLHRLRLHLVGRRKRGRGALEQTRRRLV